jgi:hypothetical protein
MSGENRDAEPPAESPDPDALRGLLWHAKRGHDKRIRAGICGHREDGCLWCLCVPKAWQDWFTGAP